MRMKLPTTIKGWVKEVCYALDEALAIQEIECESPIANVDFYKMAPAIAAIYRSIESESVQKKMIERSWSGVLLVHNELPEYKLKYKSCFVHAYLDSMIYLKVMTLKKSHKVVDFMENKGMIES